METQLNTAQLEAARLPAGVGERSLRARALALLGPVTVLGGLVWAVAQPYRLTLLHPHHQGFWRLAIEPPILVAAAGLFVAYAVVRPLLADLEAHDGTER